MTVHIDPILVELGPIRVSWYGLMYVFGFFASYLLVRYQMKKKDFGLSKLEVENLYFYLILGLIIGARLGYVLFYDLKMYLSDPLEIFAVWHGGMSFHGGFIGSTLAGLWCCKRSEVDPWQVADLVMATAPIGLGFGRLGNFINGELFGRVTDMPWGMVFPAGGPLPRHPSQLYELFLEGVALFVILWVAKDRVRVPGMLTALFILLYGAFRFFVEFFRGDVYRGFIISGISVSQGISILMFLVGIAGLIILRRKGK